MGGDKKEEGVYNKRYEKATPQYINHRIDSTIKHGLGGCNTL